MNIKIKAWSNSGLYFFRHFKISDQRLKILAAFCKSLYWLVILAFDTYYFDDKARTVCIAFAQWHATTYEQVYIEILEGIEAYEPGAFYKRELPCILSLLRKIDTLNVEAIIIDGFVFLDDNSKPGLGAHLYQSMNQSIPIIGVAKTNFATIEQNKRAVFKGESKRPLYVTSIGIDLDEAAKHVESMAGAYRIPVLLKALDGMTREDLNNVF